MGTKDGFLIAVDNHSPLIVLQRSESFAQLRSQLTSNQIRDAVPKVSFWSDIVWASWVQLCNQTGNKPENIAYIFRDTIITENTKYIMEQVIGPDAPRNGLKLPWPGRDFFLTNDKGKALQGSVHGGGPARLLYDHRQYIPRKTIQKVTVYTAAGSYYLLFVLSRGK